MEVLAEMNGHETEMQGELDEIQKIATDMMHNLSEHAAMMVAEGTSVDLARFAWVVHRLAVIERSLMLTRERLAAVVDAINQERLV